MSKIKTFVDANVLMAAFQGTDELCKKAMQILDDPNRDFIVTDYLKLEVIPQPTFHRRNEEIQFMQTFLDSASLYLEPTSLITDQAIILACKYSLGAMDALHTGAALVSKADALITLEKPEKPLCQVKEIKVVSLRS
jgi:predicted nucleic acid-binding protein